MSGQRSKLAVQAARIPRQYQDEAQQFAPWLHSRVLEPLRELIEQYKNLSKPGQVVLTHTHTRDRSPVFFRDEKMSDDEFRNTLPEDWVSRFREYQKIKRHGMNPSTKRGRENLGKLEEGYWFLEPADKGWPFFDKPHRQIDIDKTTAGAIKSRGFSFGGTLEMAFLSACDTIAAHRLSTHEVHRAWAMRAICLHHIISDPNPDWSLFGTPCLASDLPYGNPWRDHGYYETMGKIDDSRMAPTYSEYKAPKRKLTGYKGDPIHLKLFVTSPTAMASDGLNDRQSYALACLDKLHRCDIEAYAWDRKYSGGVEVGKDGQDRCVDGKWENMVANAIDYYPDKPRVDTQQAVVVKVNGTNLQDQGDSPKHKDDDGSDVKENHVVLNRNDEPVLLALKDRGAERTSTNRDLAEHMNLSNDLPSLAEKTIGISVNALIGHEFANRPFGPKGGVCITIPGIRRASKIKIQAAS